MSHMNHDSDSTAMDLKQCGKPAAEKWRSAFWVLLWVLAVGTTIPWVTSFSTVDNSVYTMGGKIVCEGGKMYEDFFDHKGPAMFWMNAWGWKLGLGRHGIGIIETLLFTFSLCVFWRGCRRSLGVIAASAGTLVLLWLESSPDFGNCPDSYAVVFTALSLGVLMGGKGLWRYALAGAAGAWVLFLKQTLIGPFLGIAVALSLRGRIRERIGNLGFFAAGGLIVALVVFGYLAGKGIVGAWYRDTFAFNLLYQNQNELFPDGFSWKGMAEGLWLLLGRLGPVAAFPLLAFGMLLHDLTRGHSPALDWSYIAGWGVWYLWDAFLVVRGGWLSPYQLHPLSFACVVAVLPFLSRWETDGRNNGHWTWGRRGVDAGLLVVAYALFAPVLLRTLLWGWAAVQANRLAPAPGWQNTPRDQIVAFVKSLPPDMPLLAWGNAVDLHLNTGRKSIGRHYYWGALRTEGFLTEGEIEDLCRQLREHPCIVVERTGEWDPGIFDESAFVSTFQRRLRDILATQYERLETGFDRPVIYLPKSPVPPPFPRQVPEQNP